MTGFSLILVVAIGLVIGFFYNRHRPATPVKENTHSFKVQLVPHDYRVTSVDLVSNPKIRTWMTMHRLRFLQHLPQGANRKPSGHLVSWQFEDSKHWLDTTGYFRNRKAPRGDVRSDPVGWTQRFITTREPHQIIIGDRSSSDTHLFERGHLIPYWITQDELAQDNLVVIPQYTNKGFEGGDASQLAFGSINREAMLNVESDLKDFLVGEGWRSRIHPGDVLQMFVEPVYMAPDQFVPIRINYYFQIVSTEGKHTKHAIMGYDVPANKLLRISIPVQLSDGTLVKSSK